MLIFLDSFLSLPHFYEALATSIVFLIMAMQFGLAYSQRQLPVLLNGIVFFSSISYVFLVEWVYVDLGFGLGVGAFGVYISLETYYLFLGSCLLITSYLLRHIFHARVITEAWFGVSRAVFFVSLHLMVMKESLEFLYPLSAVILVWLSVQIRVLVLSIVSIGVLLFYIGTLTNRWFSDVVAWPVTLLLLGLACFWLQLVFGKRDEKESVHGTVLDRS